jgi:hypothetical protein
MVTRTSIPICWICAKRVDVQSCKSDEHGKTVHKNCYMFKFALEKAITLSVSLLGDSRDPLVN